MFICFQSFLQYRYFEKHDHLGWSQGLGLPYPLPLAPEETEVTIPHPPKINLSQPIVLILAGSFFAKVQIGGAGGTCWL